MTIAFGIAPGIADVSAGGVVGICAWVCAAMLPLPVEAAVLPLPVEAAMPPVPVPLAVAPDVLAMSSPLLLVEPHPASAHASKLASSTLCCFRFMINSLC
jgi:hypothetical protein